MSTEKNNEDHQSIGDVLKEFVDKNHLQKGLDEVNIEEIWTRELGPAVNKYTTGIKLKKNTLYVHLSSSVLREELGYGKGKIIKILNECLGKELIHKLVLR